jgi:osmotically-inducible protein OsmY
MNERDEARAREARERDRNGSYQWGQRAPQSERVPWNERTHWRERESFPRDLYGRRHSSEQLFDREPFSHVEDTHYYGTGAAGAGGPGFTGGAYAYGDGPREEHRQIQDEFSDESAVSYEHGNYERARPLSGYRGFGRDYYAQDPYSRHQYGRPGLDRTGVNVRHVEHEQRKYARGPKGYQRSDERLKEDICERLMNAYYIDCSEVSIDVKGGKVSLEGSVPERYMKHSIEDIVDSCAGVTDIDNRVRVGTAVTTPAASPVGGVPTPAKTR